MSSNPGLTSEAQLRYLLQWFGEFSELQREDFLPVLAAARGGKADQLAATLAALSCADKPVSLFQCRIKLFNEWYPTWAEEEQDRLIKGVSDMDAEFGLKLQDLLTNGPKMNGELNGTDEAHSSCESEPVNEERRNNEEPEEETQELASDNVPVEIAAAS
ncbi:uncharacterized protein C14orf119 isoform X2 [Plodia interpunctella]|nr:uncharacterized protein C14orf119 isoform X2 [Plodia interpunctella]XP_053613904.1 uncharacterized protein C14orf119 isoform X2 [Plodia interpunctella]XP_053613905.1 uncharacterized protein C14orf119 isoform X2 [Plodia interpunctella]XP_053613906.1 uncharacterized protein C14orf119 isoform X2 [Plodia interpunctella]